MKRAATIYYNISLLLCFVVGMMDVVHAQNASSGLQEIPLPSASTGDSNSVVADSNAIADDFVWPATIGEIYVPDGFVRHDVDSNSFAAYLRGLPLRPKGCRVLDYLGRKGWASDYAHAVINMDIGSVDLQQCADALIRLRAEWLYGLKRYDDIVFHFTNRFSCPYRRWADGDRVYVSGGSKAGWSHRAKRNYSYECFRDYLEMVFTYAGTMSLDYDARKVAYSDMQIGDFFLCPGRPGHAILVGDMVENPSTGEKLFLVLESNTPAADIHVLGVDSDDTTTPWYSLSQLLRYGFIDFPTYSFCEDNLRRFK